MQVIFYMLVLIFMFKNKILAKNMTNLTDSWKKMDPEGLVCQSFSNSDNKMINLKDTIFGFKKQKNRRDKINVSFLFLPYC